jgi:hypothetical protein
VPGSRIEVEQREWDLIGFEPLRQGDDQAGLANSAFATHGEDDSFVLCWGVHRDGGPFLKSIRVPQTDRSCMSTILDVTIEPRMSSTGPIWSFVVINPWPSVQEAEKDVM